MSKEYDALDRLILSFEDTDPVEEVKEAMLAGNVQEASAMVDDLNPDQLDKLAETLSQIHSQAETTTEGTDKDDDEASEPEPKDKDAIVDAKASEPKATAGDEKVDNTSEGVGKDAALDAVRHGIHRALRKVAELAVTQEGGTVTEDRINSKVSNLADILLKK